MTLAQLIAGAKWVPPQPSRVIRVTCFGDANEYNPQGHQLKSTNPKLVYSTLFEGRRLATEQDMLNTVLPCFSFTEWRPRRACTALPIHTVINHCKALVSYGYLETRIAENGEKVCRRLK